VQEKTSGCWWRVNRDGQEVVKVSCPQCGQVAELQHEIAGSGKVTPSLDCPACDFHRNVQLMGWSP